MMIIYLDIFPHFLILWSKFYIYTYFDDCLTEADTENTSLKIQMAMSGVRDLMTTALNLQKMTNNSGIVINVYR